MNEPLSKLVMGRLLRGAWIVLALAVLLPASSWAAKAEQPKSFSLQVETLERVDRKVLTKIDREALVAQDREEQIKGARRPGPYRFAVAEDVSFDLENSGTWEDVAGGRLWRLVLHAPGAVSQNLGITRFELPEGAQLWIYDAARKRVDGPYTSRDRSRHGRLWTPVIESDEIVVELFVSANAGRPVVLLGKANKGYRSFSKGGGEKSHGACNNDVICPEGDPWRDQIRSVARYSINGTGLCTGQLVNNTSVDFTPLFLSANHCGVTSANDDTLVFYWNFEAPNCGDQDGGSLANNQTGSIFRASSAASDFLLVELDQDPDPSFNVFFSGWDASGAPPASTVAIHHPSGDVKSISFNTNAVTSTAYLSGTVDAAQNHWRVDDWEDGTTEPGSSGGCLWDAATKRCVGQLHGGFASCGLPNDPDWYGKLSVSWEGGGTAATRLRDWLDPGNTGTLALDGDPHITTLDGTRYDFQGAGEFVALRDPSGVEIQVRQAPIATTFNPGPDAHHGLATCVSLNTAVAAQVGKHRVTYQPNLSGVPDPRGLELRVDGKLTTLGASGLDLGNGGRISTTTADGGIEIAFPHKYTLFVTPGWWSSQSKWYLNIGVVPTTGTSGLSGASPASGIGSTGGLGGAVPRGSWLPRLPDGSSMGPMPGALPDRYTALYRKFGKAWRVSGANSLFDYAPGTSTDTFTLETWPMEQPPCVLPQVTPVEPVDAAIARRACRRIADPQTRANCEFDVRVTGEPGFARTYQHHQAVAAGATTLTLLREPMQYGEPQVLVATVSRRTADGKGVPIGTVVVTVNGKRVGEPIELDRRGRATLRLPRLEPGTFTITASFTPKPGSGFLSSTSTEEVHVAGGKQ